MAQPPQIGKRFLREPRRRRQAGRRRMSLINFILNIAGLLLWLNWRAANRPSPRTPGTPLLSTIRPAGPVRPRYYQWIALPALLVARALFYWQVGPPVHWIPQIPLGPATLSFRSDLAGRMFLFSLLSFGVTLGVCYLWLLVLSWLNGRRGEGDPIQRLVRAWLGRMDRWPGPVKLILPLVAAITGWGLLHLWLVRLRMAPVASLGQLLGQGALIGLSAYLTLKFLIVALLVLYLVNSYVYLGEFGLWPFVNATTRRLLTPWRRVPLRVWKLDFAPLLSIILVWLMAEFAHRGLVRLYHKY